MLIILLGSLSKRRSANRNENMGKLIDLSGKRFGRLTVLSRADDSCPTHWLCSCECGKVPRVQGLNLRRGVSKSCGCLRKEETSKRITKDLTGQRFGRLLVLRRLGQRPGRSVHWACRCDCGKTKVIPASSIKTGTARSCGCLRAEMLRSSAMPKEVAKLFARATRVRSGAKSKGRECNISVEDLVVILSKPCIYCNRKDSPKFPIGIDRIDSARGYVIGNCAPCCKSCNFAKSNIAVEDFCDWIEAISNQPTPRARILQALNDIKNGKVAK